MSMCLCVCALQIAKEEPTVSMRAVNSLYNEGPKETTTVRHICNTRVEAYQTMHTDNDSVSAQQRKNDFLFFIKKHYFPLH